MNYDPRCQQLARHFLGDTVSEKLVSQLAEHIQQSIEDWIGRAIEEPAPERTCNPPAGAWVCQRVW
jgi:hypothetical protein